MSKMILTLTGHKHSGKELIAENFAKNSDVAFLKPYTDRPLEKGEYPEEHGGFHYVSKERLDKIMDHQKVLCCTRINGYRYVYLERQLTASYNVMILDDYALVDVKDRWKGRIYSVKVRSDDEVQSDRVGEYYYDHEFDEVFHYGKDDFDELEARISYGFR